jgi:putative nucleotidyltransferase with HDIG domain
METVSIPIHKCHYGDVVADNVYSNRGVILLAKGTIMNDYIKEKLVDIGITNIRVCKPANDMNYQMFKKSYLTTILKTKEFICKLASGEKLELEKVKNISEEIYQGINENDSIIRCINEIQKVDEYTYTHCVNVAFYSMLIGKWMNLSENEIKKLALSGLLHDIGKIKIPNEILNKKGKLTKEEFEIMKNHTVIGYGIIDGVDGIDTEIKRVVLLHHERIDGSGYPFNAISEKISLYTKIVAIADVYDAMTSERVYKERQTPFETFEMLKTVGLGILDPTILNIFLRNISTCYIGTSVKLSNGDIGNVVYIPPHDITCPIINVGSTYINLSQESNLKIVSIG